MNASRSQNCVKVLAELFVSSVISLNRHFTAAVITLLLIEEIQ